MEFFGQLMELVELSANHLHLVMVHPPEHLDHHDHGLLKLIEHLLLHQAELIYQRHKDRFGQFGPVQVNWKYGVRRYQINLTGYRNTLNRERRHLLPIK